MTATVAVPVRQELLEQLEAQNRTPLSRAELVEVALQAYLRENLLTSAAPNVPARQDRRRRPSLAELDAAYGDDTEEEIAEDDAFRRSMRRRFARTLEREEW